MKTADLIPFLLLELYESDKYGFELTKNIETKSGGKIVIKQPTLYTLLKKLEKSKFITSYWQDSEIGGKRHYYKITDNGKLQLSTLPSYDVLMQTLLMNEENAENEENETTEKQASSTISSEEKPSSTPLETILPTSEVFKEENIDNSTVTEINQNNAELVNEPKNDENFATNTVVAKFVEVKPTPTPEIKPTNNNKNEIVDLNIEIKTNQNDVKFVDYVNLKTSKEYKKSKTFSKLTILRSSLISLFIFALLACFALLSGKFGTSMFYYASFIIGSVVAIFYPILTAVRIDKINAQYRNKDYKFNMKISLFIKFSLICLVLLVVLTYNIMIKNNSFAKILSIYNFTNFYVPVLLASSLILDSLIAYILMSKLKK